MSDPQALVTRPYSTPAPAPRGTDLRMVVIRIAVFFILAGVFAWSWSNGYCH